MNQFEKKILMAGAIKALDYIQAIELRDVAPSAQAIKNLDVFDEELTDQGVDALETIEFLDEIRLARHRGFQRQPLLRFCHWRFAPRGIGGQLAG